jgi:murein DD-endopeptidase MepM/ murein hydrolase activator NlpD
VANLKNGSIRKQPGDRISLDGVIATVGNSGSPSIPHLHIRATRGGWRPGMGTAIPMLFDGAYSVNQFATRNKIFVP